MGGNPTGGNLMDTVPYLNTVIVQRQQAVILPFRHARYGRRILLKICANSDVMVTEVEAKVTVMLAPPKL
jgi:hypothetical protein